MERTQNKKKKRIFAILAVLLAVLLLLGAAAWAAKYVYTEVKSMKAQASVLKADLKAIASAVTGGELDTADMGIEKLDADILTLKENLARPLWQYAAKLPFARTELESADTLIGLLERVSAQLLKPLTAQLRDYPLSDLKTETGFNMELINSYISFYGEIMPVVESVSEEMKTVDLGIADRDGKLTAYMQQFTTLVDLLKVVSEELITPFTAQLQACPLSDLKVGDGFNVTLLLNYVDFLEEIIPNVERVADYMETVDLSAFDAEGKLGSYTAQLREKLALYRDFEEYIPLLKTLLGNGEDHCYALVAQNTAEMRSSGGFPGSMGTINISDGVLTIGDFRAVRKRLGISTAGCSITSQELTYFSPLMNQAWDAEFCPDFERVAYIWYMSWNRNNEDQIDGVVSMTPVIIQKLLAFLGEVTLSDGTVLNGENAMRVLQHDLYFQYLGKTTYSSANTELVDELFAETAKETMHLLVSDISLSNIASFLGVFREGVADRTVLVWMSDEEAQEVVRAAGCSGGLNSDPENPQAGIYFSCTGANKMGYFIDIVPEMSEPTVNEDGSRSYEITVTVTNVITSEEIAQASSYILASGSSATGRMQFFAPAGGTVSNFSCSNGKKIETGEYNGLQLGYFTGTNFYPDTPVVITYTVTTAPGVETPLTFSTTPTAQGYRD